MNFGIVFPVGKPETALAFAEMAEAAGWDGFFMWEPVWGVDPWVTLGAIAARTKRIRLGTMLTPVSRRRPWKVAGETATLDNLSQGRAILAVGLGAVDTGFEAFGEETDRRRRAELLDEGLEIITGLWAGQPFSYEGRHYQVQETDFYPPPPPVQQPRIPIWVVGAWPRSKSMARVLRYDGVLPLRMLEDGTFADLRPEDIAAIRDYVATRRTLSSPFDIVVEGQTPGDDAEAAAAHIRPLAAAGATWWIEALWDADLPAFETRLRQGPPPDPTP